MADSKVAQTRSPDDDLEGAAYALMSLFSAIERLNCPEEIRDHDINVLALQGKALAGQLASAINECGVSKNKLSAFIDRQEAAHV